MAHYTAGSTRLTCVVVRMYDSVVSTAWRVRRFLCVLLAVSIAVGTAAPRALATVRALPRRRGGRLWPSRTSRHRSLVQGRAAIRPPRSDHVVLQPRHATRRTGRAAATRPGPTRQVSTRTRPTRRLAIASGAGVTYRPCRPQPRLRSPPPSKRTNVSRPLFPRLPCLSQRRLCRKTTLRDRHSCRLTLSFLSAPDMLVPPRACPARWDTRWRARAPVALP